MPNQFEREILDLLVKVGAILVRTKRHNVYRLPNGRNYIVSSSPRENGSKNELARLRRILRVGGFLT